MFFVEKIIGLKRSEFPKTTGYFLLKLILLSKSIPIETMVFVSNVNLFVSLFMKFIYHTVIRFVFYTCDQ